VGWRPATKQHFKLGADSSGKLVALKVEGTIETCQYDEFVEYVGSPARFLYSCPNVQVSHRLVRQDIGKPTFMRAPGESTGTYGLGCAMDELAEALKIDPVQLRLINYSEQDEDKNLPYSSKHLRQCYERGSELFGWARRNPKPGSMRNGSAQVGMGFATASYPAHQFPASAKATINADGSAVVESGSQDLGTGTYTIMTQIAAETLGLPIDRVKFQLGDTDYPFASVSGGSTTAASVGTAVQKACQSLTDKLKALAVADKLSPLANLDKDKIACSNGALLSQDGANKVDTYASILKRATLQSLQADGDNNSEKHGAFSLHSFGAQFAEVEVDPDLKVIRVTKFVGVFDCGKILNAKTARSQFMGGIIMGFGMALHEHTIMDSNYGRILNADLAEYHVPVNLDIPDLQIEWVEHPDDNFNPLGARGVGEIGITGVAAAIANAVYHATGVRVRDLPITLDKLLV
jgi:xanthine dehydrogenase YagR molybdenum-binding subunit